MSSLSAAATKLKQVVTVTAHLALHPTDLLKRVMAPNMKPEVKLCRCNSHLEN